MSNDKPKYIWLTYTGDYYTNGYVKYAHVSKAKAEAAARNAGYIHSQRQSRCISKPGLYLNLDTHRWREIERLEISDHD